MANADAFQSVVHLLRIPSPAPPIALDPGKNSVFLPNEVLLQILSHYDWREYEGICVLLKMRLVCRLFHDYASSKVFKTLDLGACSETASALACGVGYGPLRKYVRKVRFIIPAMFPKYVAEDVDEKVVHRQQYHPRSGNSRFLDRISGEMHTWAWNFRTLVLLVFDTFQHQLTSVEIYMGDIGEVLENEASKVSLHFLHALVTAMNKIALPLVTKFIASPQLLSQLDMFWRPYTDDLLDPDMLEFDLVVPRLKQPCSIFKNLKRLDVASMGTNFLAEVFDADYFPKFARGLHGITGLEKFSLWAEIVGHPVRFFPPGDEMPAVNVFSGLKALELRGFEIFANDMTEVIKQCSPTLADLHLSALRIAEGTWKTVFETCANDCAPLVKVSMHSLTIYEDIITGPFAADWRAAVPFRLGGGSRPFLSDHEEDYVAFKLMRDKTIERRERAGMVQDPWLSKYCMIEAFLRTDDVVEQKDHPDMFMDWERQSKQHHQQLIDAAERARRPPRVISLRSRPVIVRP